MVFFMLVALCTSTIPIPTGHARPLVINDMGESSHMLSSMLFDDKASPEEFSASVPISSAEDVLSVSSAPKESLGDVSVSSVPEASPVIIAPKASPVSIAPKASPVIIAPKASPVIISPKGSPVIISPKASPEQFSASVLKSSAEDVLSGSCWPPEPKHISSVPEHVSVSSVPRGSHAPPGHVSVASEEPSPDHVSIASEEPSPGHVSIDSVQYTVSEPDPGHVSIDSVPYTVSEPDPSWPPHTVSEPDPETPSTVSEPELSCPPNLIP
ncbi:hypothetical protein POM88_050458 [Heracleum sosnowskyi]|uniref:Uncharacterized protein n=1 Tax=Heracleum sosnowskyi TaxID=360622 RepID=A0AAD8GXM0_9APIA|nr:hypothetical protein POM88_050458 [Heracleum sosnowskyi]